MEPSTQPPLPPTTTRQEDLTFAGQREVNMVWERTQSLIAIGVVFFALVTDALVATVSMFTSVGDITTNQLTGVTHLNVMASLIIGFYFGRTNHQRIGGVGLKAQEYTGR